MGHDDYLSGGPYDPLTVEEALRAFNEGLAKSKKSVRPPKYLVLCTGGSVRSVTVAHILKYDYGYDALAASLERNEPSTINMLCEWADWIIVVEDKHYEQMKLQHGRHMHKTRLFPIGKDIWRMSLYPDLFKRIEELDLDTFLHS